MAELARTTSVSAAKPTGFWRQLLDHLAAKSNSIPSLLERGRYEGISDGRATIRYAANEKSIVDLLQRNGKKDLIVEALSHLHGTHVGVVFELDIADDSPDDVPPSHAATERTRAVAAPARSTSAPPSPAPTPNDSPPDTIRITPELRQSLYNSEPLIRTIVEELGGEIVRVE
ncbi:MAG: hypothetical protein JO353_13820 [Phycisphaerae bacterium]|nr:hypothetical protein [Phycisphaerae bacterium]